MWVVITLPLAFAFPSLKRPVVALRCDDDDDGGVVPSRP